MKEGGSSESQRRIDIIKREVAEAKRGYDPGEHGEAKKKKGDGNERVGNNGQDDRFTS